MGAVNLPKKFLDPFKSPLAVTKATVSATRETIKGGTILNDELKRLNKKHPQRGAFLRPTLLS